MTEDAEEVLGEPERHQHGSLAATLDCCTRKGRVQQELVKAHALAQHQLRRRRDY